jgi:hypothetical protein
MDSARTRRVVPLTAAALALGLVLVGCGKDESSSKSSSSSSASSSSATSATSATSSASSAAPTPPGTPDYASLLIKAEDIPATPDGPFTANGQPELTTNPPPTDISQMFKSGNNAIMSSVAIHPDAVTAAQWNSGVLASLPNNQTGTPVTVPSVTPDATFTSGTSLDGKGARAALLYTVENTSGMILFVSKDGDTTPVPQDYAESVGKVQVAAIQAALPGLK